MYWSQGNKVLETWVNTRKEHNQQRKTRLQSKNKTRGSSKSSEQKAEETGLLGEDGQRVGE
jgi:hypothetical protein